MHAGNIDLKSLRMGVDVRSRRPCVRVKGGTMADPQASPAGWYPDPQAPGNMRWFDGTQWTDHVQSDADARPLASVEPPSQQPQQKNLAWEMWFQLGLGIITFGGSALALVPGFAVAGLGLFPMLGLAGIVLTAVHYRKGAIPNSTRNLVILAVAALLVLSGVGIRALMIVASTS